MVVVFCILAILLVVIGIAFLTQRPNTQAIAKAREEAAHRNAHARKEADDIRNRARANAGSFKASAQQDFQEQERELQILNDSVNEQERLYREEQRNFNQSRYAFKSHRSIVEERQAALDARLPLLKEALIERAHIPREEASHIVLKNLEDELEGMHGHRVQHGMLDGDDPEPLIRRYVTQAIQRQDAPHTTEPFRTIQIALDEFPDDRRARIVDALTTVSADTSTELTIDPATGVASLRGIDPIGREVARQAALEVVERSIQTAQIPSLLDQKRSVIQKQVRSIGERKMWEMNLEGHVELAELIGTLHYRFSYGQNALLHCQETGYLCAALAAELGLDPVLARHAGMLHDIGKAVDHDVEGSHAIIGGELLQLLGVPASITHAVRAHHFEEEPTTDLAFLTICADAISASRPGARRDTISSYLARLDQLQSIATRHKGVERAYPLHAGREIRVIVHPSVVADASTEELSQSIAREIESEMNYPGIIKVMVIREASASATAPMQLNTDATSEQVIHDASAPQPANTTERPQQNGAAKKRRGAHAH